MLPVALTIPAVNMFAPVMLPVALISPSTYAPVDARVKTLAVPPTLAMMLPPEVSMRTLDVPLLILATDVITPDKNAPLPRI